MSFTGPPPLSQYTPVPVPGPPPFPYSIPARMQLLDENPRWHTNLRQVEANLLGVDLSPFKDRNGTLKTYDEVLLPQLIQAVSGMVVSHLKNPLDWVFQIDMFDGPGSNVLVLPWKNLRDVTTVVLRTLPSNTWYHFVRPRRTDGSEFVQLIGQSIPASPGPNIAGGTEPLPPGPPMYPINPVGAATIQGPIYPTGIEDADLFVDTRRHSLQIPPRVLYANLSTPLWDYNWIVGVKNVEVHGYYGYWPTAYVSGAKLTFNSDPASPNYGIVNPVNPALANDVIDWSSGMPMAVTDGVAKIVANRVLRQRWRNISEGLGSLSVDGASQSFGSSPYGGDLDAEEKRLLDHDVGSYGIQVVV